MENVIIGLLMQACWTKNAPVGIVWGIRLAFLEQCALQYPHLNYSEYK